MSKSIDLADKKAVKKLQEELVEEAVKQEAVRHA